MKRPIFGNRSRAHLADQHARSGHERNAAERSAHRKAVSEAVGGVLLVVGFTALGLLASVLLGVACGSLAAGAILVLVGNA